MAQRTQKEWQAELDRRRDAKIAEMEQRDEPPEVGFGMFSLNRLNHSPIDEDE